MTESIGQILTRYRNATGHTTITAATRLHCDESIIVALEADQFAKIGARVFVQGHLRRYADLIGAPTAELMTDLASQDVTLVVPDLTQIARAPASVVDSKAWARRLSLAAAAVVIGVVAWWIPRGAGVLNQSAQQASATVTEPVVAQSVVMADQSMTLTSTVATENVSRAVPVKQGRVMLKIDVRADCWVEIYDASGKKLYFDIAPGGGQARATGQGPLRVLLGKADVVSLEVGGRPVAIPAGFIRNSIAYFTVDATANLRPFVKPDATTGTPP
ncbi:MAG: DUF4115 domain-containing protein [Gammaproteobacteria bacterium]|nr:DUF4115 domain-containing protein [Gammaproteobacteria bacterium]